MSLIGRWWRALFSREPVVATSAVQGFFEAMLAETEFLKKYPHFASVIARMDPVATNTVPVMAVGLRRPDRPGSRLRLMVNVDFFKAHPDVRIGVLLHEIQHVVLGHLDDEALHAVAYPRLMELAMEISANEAITERLPGATIAWRAFRAFGIMRGQSTMERYRLLELAHNEGRLHIEDWWWPRMIDTHRPREGVGIGDLLDARSDRATERHWSRGRHGLGRRSSKQDLTRMRVAIARHLRGERGGDDDRLDGRTQRRIAKELQRVIVDVEGRSTLDWQRILRAAFPQSRAVHPDYLRPNRRFPKRIGEIPGRRRRPRRPSLLVAVDTSGSMNGESLDRIAYELRHLAYHARLTIVESDAAVHRVYRFVRPISTFVGGGDTDFTPAFDEARGGSRFDGIIYFTDGKGSLPELPPAQPTLWVLSTDDPFLVDWGTIVRLTAP